MGRWFAVGIVVAAIVLAIVPGRSSSHAAAQPQASPFAGKIALVLLGGEGKHAYLTDSHVEELGGKPFLVGQPIDPVSGKPLKGATSWLSIEHVLRITVFDSQEVLTEQMKQQQQQR